MAIFPTGFAAVIAARNTTLLADNGIANGTTTVAMVLDLIQLSDIYDVLMSADDTVEDVAAAVGAYTIVAADRNKVKRFLAATGVAVSVPSGLPRGFSISWIQNAAGVLTFATAVGAAQIIESPEGLRSGGPKGSGMLLCTAPNTWLLSGYTQA